MYTFKGKNQNIADHSKTDSIVKPTAERKVNIDGIRKQSSTVRLPSARTFISILPVGASKWSQEL